ncbi:Asp-tRNA(Asn)/Glu-tRNA(Gln) amidotransferase subunit GatC [Spiroplasma turonicum]|uniref:Glutamyl-tRNA(Gln) amidotransferase subunit C n=1 Tax=Spiroplasma turonicum TaxID=216946 RepID=A0A0K1P610_9MOLU|nr:Asp-tRNA(Asn)/Glu-tRNA(Gln) amidotransferase subunit GatC [Spiroplasma turonicum]AKU79357.1 glutamyl-tRNA(Gln) amidotransferase subunit C [Spiroplasma turonicum]ALX70378.1 glutamyl-tRNA(Gln) amidotransferase subunit C [Spiroplasma turonicum]
MKINFDILKSLEDDVMLDLSDKELQDVLKVENDILNKFEKVLKINTDGIRQLHYCFDSLNIYLREDEITYSLDKKDVLSNAPEKDEDYIILKKVVK